MELEKGEALEHQLFDMADQLLDLGAELLALREICEERGIDVDDDDVLVRVLYFKERLQQDRRRAVGRVVNLDRSAVDAGLDRRPSPETLRPA